LGGLQRHGSPGAGGGNQRRTVPDLGRPEARRAPDYRDSFFPAAYGSIKEYFEQIQREVAPDLVFTHRREDMHQDHRLIAELTWCAFRDHVILEYEIPKYEGDLGAPNFFVPLEETVCRRKIETVVECFSSQSSKLWFSADTFWALLRLRGVECNSPTRFAEAFHCASCAWIGPSRPEGTPVHEFFPQRGTTFIFSQESKSSGRSIWM